ncbi:MAG: ROK family protein [Firmicutes bacterium]|nr:ROK family protein [Bacillota bacterium]
MYYLGFDIGGTKSAVVLGNEKGEILRKVKVATGGPEETLEALFAAAESFPEKAAAAGISCGSPLDEEKGIIQSPPNLPGWDNIHIVEMIHKRLGIPAWLCNDANACALAEWKFGAGVGTKNMIFLTCGTGMGAGLILDGRLYGGTNGYAGEVCHMRMTKVGPVGYGKAGSYEGYTSGAGVARVGCMLATEQLQMGKTVGYCHSLEELGQVTAKSIAEAANAGDPTALEVFRIVGEKLGEGIAILVDILNPERVVIGSVFQRAENLLRPTMEEALARECLPMTLERVQVVPAKLGDEIGDVAALSIAVWRYEE